MSCPTCDHTMHGLNAGWFWCPRCRTIINRHDVGSEIPFLVERVRNLLAEGDDSTTSEATLAESVFLPKDRRT